MADEVRMLAGADIAVIGNLADFPQKRHPPAPRGQSRNGFVTRQSVKCHDVRPRLRPRQPVDAREEAEAALQVFERAEI